MNPLSIKTVFIDGTMYKITPMPRYIDIVTGEVRLLKSMAYHLSNDITEGLFPYRGVITNPMWPTALDPVGIYTYHRKDGSMGIKFRYPRTEQEVIDYSVDQITDTIAAVLNHEYSPEQFIDISQLVEADGDAFVPPIHPGDDALNTIMKTAIGLKKAPFDPYGTRLEIRAITKSGQEGQNIKNNTRRALKKNEAMSASKFAMYAEIWDLEYAIIIRDRPGSQYPMFTDGKLLAIYPPGKEFDIDPDDIISVSKITDRDDTDEPDLEEYATVEE